MSQDVSVTEMLPDPHVPSHKKREKKHHPIHGIPGQGWPFSYEAAAMRNIALPGWKNTEDSFGPWPPEKIPIRRAGDIWRLKEYWWVVDVWWYIFRYVYIYIYTYVLHMLVCVSVCVCVLVSEIAEEDVHFFFFPSREFIGSLLQLLPFHFTNLFSSVPKKWANLRTPPVNNPFLCKSCGGLVYWCLWVVLYAFWGCRDNGYLYRT